MSQASGAVAMLVAVTLTRGFGQSALSVVSLAMIGKWFRRLLTRAMAIYALVMSIGFMVAFPLVGAIVQSSGWRPAWAAIGACLVFGLAPIAWLFDRSTPESIGVEVDGGGTQEDATLASDGQTTLSGALRSPAFWVFALGQLGLWVRRVRHRPAQRIDSGRARLHAGHLLPGTRGDGHHRAVGELRGRRAGGTHLAAIDPCDRAAVLAAGLAALAHVSTAAHVMAQAVAMGVAGGFIMVVFFSFWGRAYGRAHLGRIQGAAQIMTVVASAVGPLFLAMWSRGHGLLRGGVLCARGRRAHPRRGGCRRLGPAGARATG